MLITLVKKQNDEPPSSENPGEVVWIGGRVGEESGESDDQLPASILNIIANIEVGFWYKLTDFSKLFDKKNLTAQPDEIWTEIDVPVLRAESKADPNEKIQVLQLKAVEAMVKAIINLAIHLEKKGRIWIRVE
ncbi:MAG: hypothetical protein WBW55_02525 [Desulfobaccales bacterium]